MGDEVKATDFLIDFRMVPALRPTCRSAARGALRHGSTRIVALAAALILTACGAVESSSRGASSLDEVFSIEAPRERARALDEYLTAAGPADLPAVLERFESERMRLDVVSVGMLALWWTGFDPAGAYEEGRERHFVDAQTWASIVVREWARIAPDAALAAVRDATKRHGGVDWQRELALSVIRGWLDVPGRDLEPLLAFARSLPAGRPQKEALDTLLVRKIHQSSVDEAIEFVERLPNLDRVGRDPFKHDAFKRLATQLAARDPARAIAWAERHAGHPFGAELRVRIARRWSRDDPAAAIAWAETIPLPEASGSRGAPATSERAQALKAALRNWLTLDPAAARAWVDAQPYDDRLHPLLELTLLHQAGQGDGTGALARLEARDDVADPTPLIVTIGQVWRRQDEASAEAWLASAGLEPAVERAIRNPPRRRGAAVRTSPL